MRFVSYRDAGTLRFGVIETQSVVTISVERPGVASDLSSALAAGIDLIGAARAALASSTPRLPYASLTLAPPVPRPGRIFCLGSDGGDPADPSAFRPRNAASLLAPREPGTRPPEAGRFEPGAGLAIVVGQPARHRSAADALDCVFGYSCFSDLIACGAWPGSPSATTGAMLEGPAALGPSLVTRDELPPGADELRVQCRLDGVVIQDASTSDLGCSVAEAIVRLSARTTLEPGDLITIGVPVGAGLVRMRPPGLAPVGRVEIDIDRIGVLTNPVGHGVVEKPLSRVA